MDGVGISRVAKGGLIDMREVGELIFAFLVLLSGAAIAPLAGMAAVQVGAAAGVNPGAALLLATFGFLGVVIAGWEIITRHSQRPHRPAMR